MMLEDFPRLCRLWKLIAQYNPSPGYYCFSGKGQPLTVRSFCSLPAPKVIFRIERPELFDADENTALKVVNQLEQITGFGYDLTITSKNAHDPITTPEFLQNLKATMAPRLIWIHARELDRLKLAREMRAEILASGNIHQVYLRYIDLILHYSALRERELNDPYIKAAMADNPQMNTVARQGIALDFRMHFDLAALALRVGSSDSEAWTWIHKCYKKLKFYHKLGPNSYPVRIFMWPGEMELQVLHLWILIKMRQYKKDPFDKFLPRITLQSVYKTCFEHPDQNLQSRHDLRILEPLMDESNQVRYSDTLQ